MAQSDVSQEFAEWLGIDEDPGVEVSQDFVEYLAEAAYCIAGITLRGQYDDAGDITRGYVLQINFGVSGGMEARIRRVVGGVSTTIAGADVSSGYGLALNANFELRASVENVGGSSEATGQPVMTMSIDGQNVTDWQLLDDDIAIDDDEVVDESSVAILSGSSQGLYLVPPQPSEGELYYRDWNDDFVTDPGDVPPEDEATIPVGVECSGKTGTFAAPVGSQIGVEVTSRSVEHGYESMHVARILQDSAQRRLWRIEMPAGMTTTEKADLWTFWNAHGKSIPFDFADPESGDLVCAHFFDDSLATVKAAPASASYECVIEELLEGAALLQIVPTFRRLTLTTYAPSLSLVAPGTRALTITTYAPVLLLTIIPGTLALTTTTFAPVFSLGLIPGPRALVTVRTTPTVIIA